MSARPFRFIHASDLHLENPLLGVADVPDHLRELFLEAPFIAARKIFDAVLDEGADFLLLAGDVLCSQSTGPRGPLFLNEQFLRLAERGIEVFWSSGQFDPPESWPESLPLPGNVHVFPRGRADSFLVYRAGEPVARISGRARDRHQKFRPVDFLPDAAGLYTIVVAHTETDAAAVETRGINFWAFGGRHDRTTFTSNDMSSMVHYSGTPQGRCPDEQGTHGCTLVQVDEQQTHISFIPTDSVRWHTERISITENTTLEELALSMKERLRQMAEAMPSVTLLVSWVISGRGMLFERLRRSGLAIEILEQLRAESGFRSPAVWSLGVEVELPEMMPAEWYEQENIRGDFLRAVRHLQMNPEEPLGLDTYLPGLAEGQADELFADAINPEGRIRERLLREAAALGVDLLSGEELQS